MAKYPKRITHNGTRGMVKLIDIINTSPRTFRQQLYSELERHSVSWTNREHARFTRYFVYKEHLCCARTIVDALLSNNGLKIADLKPERSGKEITPKCLNSNCWTPRK